MHATRRFPALRARDLEGREVELPGAFEGEPTVVLIAFRRAQQDDVDSWVAWLEDWARRAPRLRYYEIPTISRRWTPLRPFIDGGMATAIRDREMRRRTLTAYTDVRRVLSALGLEGTGQIVILILDRDGGELARALGPYDADAAVRMESAAGGK